MRNDQGIISKLDYLLWGIHNDKHLQRGWLLAIFGILPAETPLKLFTTVGIRVSQEVMQVEMNGVTKDIAGYDWQVGTPLFNRDDKIQIKAGDLRSVYKDITTTYGLLIINALIIEYPYAGKVEYLNEEITPKLINAVAYNALIREDVTIDMHLRLENGLSFITALSQTGVPSATRKSVTINPAIAELKPGLLKEYADKLHDPAAVAELQSKIAALDKAYLKGDASERFFIKGKSAMSRLRTSGMFGAEADIQDESKIKVMTNSLAEGWTVKDIPMMANAIRGGSFARGASTALGGVAVKETARVFQNYTISTTDCHTDRGIPLLINAENFLNFKGRYLVGNDAPLTDTDLTRLSGKYINLRSPAFCKAEGTAICYKCFGDIVANSGVGVNALMMTTTSNFLNIFMGAMHSSILTTYKYNYLNRIT